MYNKQRIDNSFRWSTILKQHIHGTTRAISVVLFVSQLRGRETMNNNRGHLCSMYYTLSLA